MEDHKSGEHLIGENEATSGLPQRNPVNQIHQTVDVFEREKDVQRSGKEKLEKFEKIVKQPPRAQLFERAKGTMNL